MRKLVLLVIATVVIAATPAVAQEEEPGPITWIAYSTVKSGKTGDAVQFTLKDKDFMDGLITNGTVISWGLATPINHRPDDQWNHAQWVTVESWEKIGAWVGAFQQYMNGIDEAEQKARQEQAKEIYEEGSHFDSVVRHVAFKPAAQPARPQFLYFGLFKAKPGEDGGVVRLFNDFVVPLADKLQADGAIKSYGMYVSDLHGDKGWTHTVWYALPSLGALDKMQAAFSAAGTPAFNAWAESVFEPDAHSDQVLLVLHYNGPGAE